MGATNTVNPPFEGIFYDYGGAAYNVQHSKFGATGDGVTDDYTALSAANTLATSTGGVLVFPPGTYVVGTSLTFASNVALDLMPGAVLSPSSGKTVTINGPVRSGPWSIFSGAGDVVLALRQDVYPEWWGATVGAASDSLAALQAAHDNSPAGSPILLGGDYLISDTWKLGSDAHVRGMSGRNSKIVGDNLTTDLIASTNKATRYYSWILEDFTIDNQDKANSGAVGLNMQDISLAKIRGVYIENVEGGFFIKDEAFYNQIEIEVNDTVTAVEIQDGASSGANENAFDYLRIVNCTTGVIVDGSDNVVFKKPSIENFTTGFDIGPSATTLHILVIQPRLEGGTTGIHNESHAESTLVVGGHVATVTTTYTNDAAVSEFAWIGNDTVAWLRPRLGHLLLYDDSDNIKAQVYADATRLFVRNSADSGDLAVWCGDVVASGALSHTGSTAGFYNTSPIAQQTGVAVSAAGIHAALVALGLFTA